MLRSLFPNTKFGKYIIQLVLIRYLTGYFTQVMQAAADVQRQQIAG